jgi:hypothetical protein
VLDDDEPVLPVVEEVVALLELDELTTVLESFADVEKLTDG